jgi:threonine/homoserine/homoserine lactone efflux protein
VNAHVLPFLGVAALIIVTPGVDMALVTKNAVMRGRGAALATALGVNAGIVVWIAASALGVAALVRASAAAFAVLKLAGALYLLLLGLQALRHARRTAVERRVRDEPGELAPAPGWVCFRQGIASNLLNPKVAVLFVSLIPQFVAPGPSAPESSLVLGALFNLMGTLWLCSYALLAARAAGVLRRPAIRARIEAVTGTVLIALGVRLAIERR